MLSRKECLELLADARYLRKKPIRNHDGTITAVIWRPPFGNLVECPPGKTEQESLNALLEKVTS